MLNVPIQILACSQWAEVVITFRCIAIVQKRLLRYFGRLVDSATSEENVVPRSSNARSMGSIISSMVASTPRSVVLMASQIAIRGHSGTGPLPFENPL